MKNDIIENNEIIATFVGAKIIAEYEDHNLFDYGILLSSKDKEIAKLLPENKRYIPSFVMKYHSSWDWLMPVVEKIATISTNYPYGIFKYLVNIELNPITGIEIKDMYNKNFEAKEGFEISIYQYNFMTNVWLAVVEFIKWYNNNENDK